MQYEQIDQLILESSHILITSHIRPDADAIASVLAFKSYIDQKFPGKDCEICVTAEPTNMWDFIDTHKDIQWLNDIAIVFDKFDLAIFLDGNHADRFSSQLLDISKIKTICIDHHPNPPDNYTLDLSDNSAAANCLNLYKILFAPQQQLLDQHLIRILLTGIIGDTGTFRYVNYHNSEVLEVARYLIDKGKIDIQELEFSLNQISIDEFDILKQLITNTQTMFLDGIPPFTFSYLPVSILEKYPNEHTIKNAVNQFMFMFMRRIDNCLWGFVVSPRNELDISINFRSSPSGPNVKVLANEFGGGGHVFAAGAQYLRKSQSDIDSSAICQMIITKIKNTKLTYVD